MQVISDSVYHKYPKEDSWGLAGAHDPHGWFSHQGLSFTAMAQPMDADLKHPGYAWIRTAIVLVLVVSAIHGRNPGGWIVSSLGEGPFSPASDIGGSGPLPQFGIGVDYSTRFLTPYDEITVGWHNGGPLIENFAGIHAGYRIKGIMPGLTAGAGIQSANEKRFIADNAVFTRKLNYPWGLGLRVDFFRRVTGEFEQRNEGSVPWWRLKVGIRLL